MTTIETIARDHYLPEKRARRRATTVEGYESSIRLHVLPAFGSMEIAEITRDAVQAWVDSIHGAGAAEKAYKCLRQIIRWAMRRWALQVIDPTVGVELPPVQAWVDSIHGAGAAEKAYKCLRQIIRWAMRRWALQVIDPTVGVELPLKPKYRPAVLDARQLSDRLRGFWGHAHEATVVLSSALGLRPVGVELPLKPKYRPAVLDARQLSDRLRGFWGHAHEATVVLSSALGLRPGECYALEWRDVDMRSGAVRVSKTLQECRAGVLLYPTKTAQSDRTVYLPRWARERLRDLWRAAGKPRERIIGDERPSTVKRRIARHAERAGLPRVTMENTRHTWATVAVAAGVPIETVAMMLGHASMETAYQHYIRPSRSIMVDAQRKVEAHMLAS